MLAKLQAPQYLEAPLFRDHSSLAPLYTFFVLEEVFFLVFVFPVLSA